MKKVENIMTSVFQLGSGAEKAEILRNSALLMSAKLICKNVNKCGVNVCETFTEKFEDDGLKLIHSMLTGQIKIHSKFFWISCQKI